MRRSVVLLVFLLVGYCSQAQVNAGIALGLNLSKMSHEGTSEFEVMCMGGHVNIPINFTLYNQDKIKLGLQPEIELAQKGSKEAEDTISVSLVTNYVGLPLMLKAQYGEGAVRPFVNLGPSLSYHLMYYSISKINNKFSNSEAASPDKTYMNVMDFGFNVGAGCNFSSFMLEVRYGIGFSNVFKDVTSKNRVLSFSLGYLIP